MEKNKQINDDTEFDEEFNEQFEAVINQCKAIIEKLQGFANFIKNAKNTQETKEPLNEILRELRQLLYEDLDFVRKKEIDLENVQYQQIVQLKQLLLKILILLNFNSDLIDEDLFEIKNGKYMCEMLIGQLIRQTELKSTDKEIKSAYALASIAMQSEDFPEEPESKHIKIKSIGKAALLLILGVLAGYSANELQQQKQAIAGIEAKEPIQEKKHSKGFEKGVCVSKTRISKSKPKPKDENICYEHALLKLKPQKCIGDLLIKDFEGKLTEHKDKKVCGDVFFPPDKRMLFRHKACKSNKTKEELRKNVYFPAR